MNWLTDVVLKRKMVRNLAGALMDTCLLLVYTLAEKLRNMVSLDRQSPFDAMSLSTLRYLRHICLAPLGEVLIFSRIV